MAYAVLKRSSMSAGSGWMRRAFASVSVGTDLLSALPSVSLQKARRYQGHLSTDFSTTPLSDIFKGKKVVIFGLPGFDNCTTRHVSTYKNNINKFKAKGIDSAICVAVIPPYAMDDMADRLQAKKAIEFYGDFDGSFYKSLGLVSDLSHALLGPCYKRWSAYVVDGKVKALNVEESPAECKVTSGDAILGQIDNCEGCCAYIVHIFHMKNTIYI